MLNYGAPSWVYGEITEFAKQTAVRELLLGQCCDGLFAIVAVYVFGRTCYKLYNGKRCILGKENGSVAKLWPPISGFAIAQY